MQSRNPNNLRGIDVSNWQGDINWGAVAAAGIQVAYIKATEGTGFTDSYAEKNYQKAKALGIKVGFYHYLNPKADPIAQAHYFINAINGMEPDCRYALDIEETDGVSKELLSAAAKSFLDEVKNITGKEVVIYTFTNFAQNSLTNILSIYPLWIAHYGVNTPASNPIWDNWIGFQYSSTNKVDGVNGFCDVDEFTQNILLNHASTPVISSVPQQTQDSKIFTISQVQHTLNVRYGFNLDCDNIAGALTFKAIYMAIQTELNNQFGAGLAVDGVPGPKTLAACITVRQGAQGNLTWLIQALLICNGYDLSPYGADSDFGDLTKLLVQNFQASKGLSADGVVGQNTWKKFLRL